MAEPQPIAVAEMLDVRSGMAQLLRAISFSSKAWLSFTEAGLRVCVEVGRSVQAVAYLPTHLFTNYTYTQSGQEEETCIEFNLDTLMTCLDIFGSSKPPAFSQDKSRHDSFDASPATATALQLHYLAPGEPLVLLLSQSGAVTRCELATYDPDDILDLAFADDADLSRVIINSEALKEAFSAVGADTACDTISFRFEHRESALVVGSKGAQGSSEVEFGFDREVVEVFECPESRVHTYAFAHLKHIKEAMNASLKTSIRTDESGLLSLQFMVPIRQTKSQSGRREPGSGFVEFLCMPLEDIQ